MKLEVKVTGRYCSDILLSQLMLGTIKRVIVGDISSAKHCTDAYCVQHSSIAPVQNSQLPSSSSGCAVAP